MKANKFTKVLLIIVVGIGALALGFYFMKIFKKTGAAKPEESENKIHFKKCSYCGTQECGCGAKDYK